MGRVMKNAVKQGHKALCGSESRQSTGKWNEYVQTMEMSGMQANPGDRIILRSRYLVRPIRDGEIIEVRGGNGEPPYVVRWTDDDQPMLVVPGSNAHILPHTRRPRPPESSP